MICIVNAAFHSTGIDLFYPHMIGIVRQKFMIQPYIESMTSQERLTVLIPILILCDKEVINKSASSYCPIDLDDLLRRGIYFSFETPVHLTLSYYKNDLLPLSRPTINNRDNKNHLLSLNASMRIEALTGTSCCFIVSDRKYAVKVLLHSAAVNFRPTIGIVILYLCNGIICRIP